MSNNEDWICRRVAWRVVNGQAVVVLVLNQRDFTRPPGFPFSSARWPPAHYELCLIVFAIYRQYCIQVCRNLAAPSAAPVAASASASASATSLSQPY